MMNADADILVNFRRKKKSKVIFYYYCFFKAEHNRNAGLFWLSFSRALIRKYFKGTNKSAFVWF